MTYQGERAQPADSEINRVFEVSQVRLGAQGRVTEVRWTEVDARSNRDVDASVLAPVAEVVDAIHSGARVMALFSSPDALVRDRQFVVIAHAQGQESIALDGHARAGRDLADMPRIAQGPTPPAAPARSNPAAPQPKNTVHRNRTQTFAVSKLVLDPGGRVTDVLWGRVDTAANAWATPEVVAPVAEVVRALMAGDQVFALFPSAHGHLPDRQFVVADYDGGLQTIVLAGPPTHEREIHDMDRLDARAPT